MCAYLCTCAYANQSVSYGLFPSLYVVYLKSEGALCLYVSHASKCVSSILHLCVKQRGEGVRRGEGKRERDMACCKGGAGEGSQHRSDEAGNDRKVALLSVAFHPGEEQMAEGGRGSEV